MIEEKYNIKYIDNSRCYKINLNERNFFLDYSSPQLLIIDGKEIDESSWSGLMGRLYNYLIRKHNISKEQLLSFSVEWSKKHIFSDVKMTGFDYGPLENNLYYNVNNSSTHLQWTIQDFLLCLNEDLSQIELYIKIPASKEKDEVINYYFQLSKNKLKIFLSKRIGYDNKKISRFMSQFEKVDNVFKKYFKNQVSLLLLEDKHYYAMYKSKLLAKFNSVSRLSDLTERIKCILDDLNLFYAYLEESLVIDNMEETNGI